jgi:hypothetical protein
MGRSVGLLLAWLLNPLTTPCWSSVMSEQKVEKRNWLFFFPMYGIDITDVEHDLDSPMFGDWTIVSSEHLPDIKKLHHIPHFQRWHL